MSTEKCLRELQKAIKIKNQIERRAVLKYLCSKPCVQDAIQKVLLSIEKMNLTSGQKMKLYKFRRTIRNFRKSKLNNKKRKSVMIGEGLPFLIPAALSILPTIIDLFKK